MAHEWRHTVFTSTRFAPALRHSNIARNLFNPHSAKRSGHAGTLRGFLHRGLYDACPHAPVARAHVRGRGQASYKPKHLRTFAIRLLPAAPTPT